MQTFFSLPETLTLGSGTVKTYAEHYGERNALNMQASTAQSAARNEMYRVRGILETAGWNPYSCSFQYFVAWNPETKEQFSSTIKPSYDDRGRLFGYELQFSGDSANALAVIDPPALCAHGIPVAECFNCAPCDHGETGYCEACAVELGLFSPMPIQTPSHMRPGCMVPCTCQTGLPCGYLGDGCRMCNGLGMVDSANPEVRLLYAILGFDLPIAALPEISSAGWREYAAANVLDVSGEILDLSMYLSPICDVCNCQPCQCREIDDYLTREFSREGMPLGF